MQKYVIALYIRLSIEDYKYDSLSIENQSLVLHEYAASMPEALNAEIMEFIDNGYSGTNFERPQVQKLIELVRANQIDCIIVKDFSRFGRNSIETGYFIERVFPLFHTRFISISDDFDSSKFKGDTGGMDVAFKYLISEYYSRDMSIKTKSAKYAKMQRGEYQSKICPYGYRKSADGRMEPDPEAAAVVQLIFQLAAEGINATAITRELFRRNIPTPGQYKAAHGNHTHDISRCHGIWSTSTILRILEDERYTGVYVIGKRAVLEVGGTRSRLKDRESWYIIPDHHPAIVEKAVFDTVQASQLRFSQPNKKKRDYPLKGKAFCGCCGHALSRTMQKTSYYHCRHSEADVESRCHKMRLNAAELEQAVFLTLKKQMEAAAPLAPDGTLRVDASVRAFISTLEQERQKKQEEIRALEAEIDGIYQQEDERARLRDINARKGKVIGRISLWVESVQNDTESEQQEQVIREIEKRVQEIDSILDTDSVDERKQSALSRIQEDMTKWAKELQLEHCDNPYRLDLNKVTVIVDKPERPVPLKQLGSGSNWVGVHLIAYFALQHYFIGAKRPVPRFMFLDQPSQVYFPSEFDEKKTDWNEVNKIYQFVIDRTTELQGQLQVIIVDHADLKKDSFREFIRENWWPDDKNLVPIDWYKSE